MTKLHAYTATTHAQADFETALQAYYAGCQRIYREHMANNFPNNTVGTWELHRLQKRARIKCGSAAHSFVDYATGDVLMPESWSRPAKHARGNIFDDYNGLRFIGPYGPASLRR